jgi:hypothetical protein
MDTSMWLRPIFETGVLLLECFFSLPIGMIKKNKVGGLNFPIFQFFENVEKT